ncbi:hypothetical protein [Brucella anthropi]|uniref:hypothetical protein n=1 Tax=Brucella anthropi TaxID=529 RepID=UPI001CFE282F|nr:hypothetical protein [Brucella anthropi]
MANFLIQNTDIALFDDEPRVLDTDLAAWLGFEHPRQVRELIARNRDELETYGSLSCRTTNPGKQGGRPGKAYYLNEGQALVICALSKTNKAAEVRKALIDVFTAYRQGKIISVKGHYRQPPAKPQKEIGNFSITLDNGVAYIMASVPVAMGIKLTEAYRTMIQA